MQACRYVVLIAILQAIPFPTQSCGVNPVYCLWGVPCPIPILILRVSIPCRLIADSESHDISE